VSMKCQTTTCSAKHLKLCTNCLSHHHSTERCRSGNCRKCQHRYHSLLHDSPTTGSGETVATQTLMVTLVARMANYGATRQRFRVELHHQSPCTATGNPVPKNSSVGNRHLTPNDERQTLGGSYNRAWVTTVSDWIVQFCHALLAIYPPN
jgi:hypothetical protein